MTSKSKSLILLLIFCLTGLVLEGCFIFKKKSNQRLFLAQNLWVDDPEYVSDVNYRIGLIIPAGSEVVKLKEFPTQNIITFKELPGKNKITLHFEPENHKNLTLSGFRNQLFTIRNFKELAENLTEAEISSIKTGNLTTGLRKSAVLILLGHPPATLTSSLDDSVWIYWVNRSRKQVLSFDEYGILKEISN